MDLIDQDFLFVHTFVAKMIWVLMLPSIYFQKLDHQEFTNKIIWMNY
jgi:hypothetical protein